MNDEILLIQLRDCFTAGYTMPQFCIDNGIKKPLFVAVDVNHWQFLWEIYVQFKYDKRIQPEFALIKNKIFGISFDAADTLPPLKIPNLSDIKLNGHDIIIILTANKLNIQIPSIYLDELSKYFIRKTYAEIPLLHFMQKYPKVKLFLTNFPVSSNYEGGIEFNKRLPTVNDFKNVINSNIAENEIAPFENFNYTIKEAREIVNVPDVRSNADGSTFMLSDANNSPLQNIVNGKRTTAYQPEEYINKIYFVGACHHYGMSAPYDKTIESYLQKMLNDSGYPYRVENESQRFGSRNQDIFYSLCNLQPKDNDIIFVWVNNFKADRIPFVDVSKAFDPPYDYRKIFIIQDHVNEIGYKAVAENFFTILVQNNFFKDIEFKYPAPPPPPHRYGIPKETFTGNVNLNNNKELEDYKQQLRGRRLKIGSIVMNCNPFTLGHEYLIEYAAARVSKLYIFVVEEDKSEFKFADRLKLVQEGVKQFPNVEVIPSGKFIISQQTFSGYFNKSELQDVAVDSSEDVEIFAREIAPPLGINIRFVGEEPEDTVTHQYNDNMRVILPRYGIDFCEIPRREINGEVISAKAVRAALKVGDFDKIQMLVPKTTLQFLKNIRPITPPT